MTCSRCGAACQGGLCQQCLVEQNHAHLAEEISSDSVWDSDHDDDTEVGDDD